MIEQKYIDRFHTKYTIISTGCWEWNAAKDLDDYGIYSIKSKNIKAHRFSAQYIGNMNIDKLLVCHKCDNPSCVNPEHLFVGTGKDNMMDCKTKGRLNTNPFKKKRLHINETIIKDIRSRRLSGQEFSKLYNISDNAVYQIWSNKTWKHI